jgi:hypothetical protein
MNSFLVLLCLKLLMAIPDQGDALEDVKIQNPGPKGIHIAHKDHGGESKPGKDSMRAFYLEDENGKRRSDDLADAPYPLRRIVKLVWFNEARFFLVIDERIRDGFDLTVFARDSKGFYRRLSADIDGDEIQAEISRLILKKAPHALTLEPSGSVMYGLSVDTAHLAEDDNGFTVPVDAAGDGKGEVQILYKFEYSERKFIRKGASIVTYQGKVIFRLAEAELRQALKKP